ncbi:MAG TPA: M3 family oligoendopeptidase [Rickettsiales bacterium]|nr:M3 family oligoendopeptidase [Rickettsiales bacterium]
MTKQAKTALPQWNLKDFYDSLQSPAVGKDIKRAQAMAEKFAKEYAGRVAKLEPKEFTEAVKQYEALSELLGKLGSYASLLYAGDMSKPENAQFYQNIQETLTNITSELLFFTLSVNKLSDAQAKKLLNAPEFAHYAPWLRELRVLKPYQLSDEIEKLLHEKQVAGAAAWSRHFDEVIGELRFPVNKKPLVLEEALHLMSDSDEKKRKEAALAVGDVLAKNIKTFALITNTLAKDKEIEDKWRGFKRPISSRNIANQVEDEVVDALMTSVRANYKNLTHRYYKMKAGWLGKKQLAYWDRAAPLPKVPERKYSWDEARELVLSAYAAFSPTLAKTGKQFFEKNWIDAEVRPGKAPGAFAHPCVPSVHPYLLVNFQGKARDVMTLAHELGHGVHQCLSAKQGALLSDTPLTLAETASVFGEQLAFREMLAREKNAARRKSILAGKVEDMLATVVRQIAMCEFEVRVHDERRKGELTSEQIGQVWVDVQTEALGKHVKVTSECRHFWAYIPHFIHTPFYVYAYAFGDCLVNSLYSAYQKEQSRGKAKDFEQKYIKMLESGGRYRHKELLAPFGLDASKPSFWQGGLDVIAGLIDELEGM